MIKPFAPRIFDEIGQGTFYEDGRVWGAVDVSVLDGKRHLLISEWTSEAPGQGHSRAALQWLRPQFEVIAAQSVGMIEDGVPDISICYWAHVKVLGLVDVLIDDERVELEVLPDETVRRPVTPVPARPAQR